METFLRGPVGGLAMRRSSSELLSVLDDDCRGLDGGLSRRVSSSGTLHGLGKRRSTTRKSRTRAEETVETKAPVSVEFVYADGRRTEPLLCGAWCDWKPVSMNCESEDVWSIIVPVPCGYQEFCFLVDGKYVASSKHPTTADGACNWRTIYGPPLPKSRTLSQRLGRSIRAIAQTLDVVDFVRKSSSEVLQGLKVDEESSCVDDVAKATGYPASIKYLAITLLVYAFVYGLLLKFFGDVEI